MSTFKAEIVYLLALQAKPHGSEDTEI